MMAATDERFEHGLSCSSGKVCYSTKQRADAFVKRLSRAWHDRRPAVYKCKRCPWWHTTTYGDQAARGRRTRRRKVRESWRYER